MAAAAAAAKRESPPSSKTRVMVATLAVGLVILVGWQVRGHSEVASADSGAPLEIAKRAVPIRPRLSLDNSTVTFNASNPFGRVAHRFELTNKTIPPAWDLRENKAREKKNIKNQTVPKPKKVFEATEAGQGFLPGEAVVPSGGTKVKEMRNLEKLARSKCVSVVAFYNSEDAVKSKELAAIWNEFRALGNFHYGLCDVHSTGGLEVAVFAGVYPNGTAPAIGLPAVLAYPSKDFLNETVLLLQGTSKKDGLKKPSSSDLANTAANVVANLKLDLSKEGCYSKLKHPIADSTLLRQAPTPPADSSNNKLLSLPSVVQAHDLRDS